MTFKQWADQAGFGHLKAVAPIRPAPIFAITEEVTVRVSREDEEDEDGSWRSWMSWVLFRDGHAERGANHTWS